MKSRYRQILSFSELFYLFLCRMTIRDEIIPRAVSWFMGDAALEERVQISAQHSDFLKSLSHNVMECVASLRPIQVVFCSALKFVVVVLYGILYYSEFDMFSCFIIYNCCLILTLL